ncbi:MAG: hypothetical protein L6R30_23075 [Thermoanaerobaculia bacterium]|nr:hypothetical protein [Thermoanaerobaculia bacterium]
MFLRQRTATSTSSFGALLVSVVLCSSTPLHADRRDQRSADSYSDAVSLIVRGKNEEAIPLLLGVLWRGAREPNESQGSQTRFLVYRYDPYYWLGIAFMESGDDERALLCFGKSELYGVIRKWPDWYADLTRRQEELQRRFPAPISEPPPLPTCIRRERERFDSSCLSILSGIFGDHSFATPAEELFVQGELAFLARRNHLAAGFFRQALEEDSKETLASFRYRALNAEDYLPHFYLGLALAELGSKDEARAELEESRRQIVSLHRPAVRRVLEKALTRVGGR